MTKKLFALACLGLSLLGAPRAALAQTAHAPSKVKIPLHSGWKFREAGKQDWHPATVPGFVHTDLLANRLIEDPFFRDNEARQQWIGKTEWEYETAFDVPAAHVARARAELVEGGRVVSSNAHFFRPYKELALPAAVVSTEVAPARGGFRVTVSADRLARGVRLSAEGVEGAFSDNYFDLVPGRPVAVEFRAARGRARRLPRAAARTLAR